MSPDYRCYPQHANRCQCCDSRRVRYGDLQQPASAVALKNTVSGEVERITVLDPTDRWSRGTMVVAGQNVIIPRNMVIDLPANRLTLQELFVNTRRPAPLTRPDWPRPTAATIVSPALRSRFWPTKPAMATSLPGMFF